MTGNGLFFSITVTLAAASTAAADLNTIDGKTGVAVGAGAVVAGAHPVEAVAQHGAVETGRAPGQHGEHFRRAFVDRAEEGVELDLGDQDHAASQRAQRVGQALLLPAIGLAALRVEKIQRHREVRMARSKRAGRFASAASTSARFCSLLMGRSSPLP